MSGLGMMAGGLLAGMGSGMGEAADINQQNELEAAKEAKALAMEKLRHKNNLDVAERNNELALARMDYQKELKKGEIARTQEWIDPESGDTMAKDVDSTGTMIGDARIKKKYKPKETIIGNVLYKTDANGNVTAEDIELTPAQKIAQKTATAAEKRKQNIADRTHFTAVKNDSLTGIRSVLSGAQQDNKYLSLIAAIDDTNKNNAIKNEAIVDDIKKNLSPAQKSLITKYTNNYKAAKEALDSNPTSAAGIKRATTEAKKVKVIKDSGVPEKEANKLLNFTDNQFASAKAIIASGIINDNQDALNSYKLLLKLDPKKAASVEEEFIAQKGEIGKLKQAGDMSKRQNVKQSSSQKVQPPNSLTGEKDSKKKAAYIVEQLNKMTQTQIAKRLKIYKRRAEKDKEFEPVYDQIMAQTNNGGLLKNEQNYAGLIK